MGIEYKICVKLTSFASVRRGRNLIWRKRPLKASKITMIPFATFKAVLDSGIE